MNLKRAFQIVIELAEQNILVPDDESGEAEAAEQQAAVDALKAFNTSEGWCNLAAKVAAQYHDQPVANIGIFRGQTWKAIQSVLEEET